MSNLNKVKQISVGDKPYDIDAKYWGNYTTDDVKTINGESIFENGGGDIDTKDLVEITYGELKTLKENNKLTPGRQYRITDYVTTTVQENTQSAGHQFDIIVTALNEYALSEEANAVIHEFDIHQSYFLNSNLSAWKIWYCFENDVRRFVWADERNGKGVIYRMIDEWGNDCPYDFKNIMFTRYELNIPDEYIAENIEKKWLEILSNNIRNKFDEGLLSYIWSGIDESGKYWEENYEILYSTTTGKTKDFYTFSDFNGETVIDASLGGNTHDNLMGVNYTELPNNVVLGDYCSSNTFDNDCYFNTFGDNCHHNTFNHSCFTNIFGNNCNSNTFGVNCNSNTFGNGCEYNTFGMLCGSNIFSNECNSNTFGVLCHSNTFVDNCSSNTFGIYCYSNNFGNDCCSNIFGDGCYSNTFGNSCNSNTFGDSCYSNTFGNACHSNTFGSNCYSNKLGNYCYYNTFGNNFISNTFGNDCEYNTFGNYCQSNTFGNSCSFNTFGNYCHSNTFGNDCYYNTFGNDCESIKFYDTNNEIKNNIGKVLFEDQCKNITLICGSDGDALKNYNFKKGVRDTSINIEFLNSKIDVYVYATSVDGVVQEYFNDSMTLDDIDLIWNEYFGSDSYYSGSTANLDEIINSIGIGDYGEGEEE